jgi:hypothetical protein
MSVRHCINPKCDRTFSECMGYVIARDMIECQSGLREWKHIREVCGVCVFFFENKLGLFETMLRENPIPKSLPA